MIYQIENVLFSEEIFTQYFCCDLEKCKGACCIEGDAGAPVTLEEIAQLEDSLDIVWQDLSASAQAVIDKQGVAYTDREGELVTSIVGGKDCVFTYYDELSFFDSFSKKNVCIKDCCLCATEKAYRAGKSKFCKPISCALYPLRLKNLSNGTVAMNYNEWDVCKPAREKGAMLKLPLWKFLREPLIRRFGVEWYEQLEVLAHHIKETQASS